MSDKNPKSSKPLSNGHTGGQSEKPAVIEKGLVQSIDKSAHFCTVFA